MPQNSPLPERRVRQSSDILHLIEILAIAFGLHVVAMDEPQAAELMQ
jgi:hypothetical protein